MGAKATAASIAEPTAKGQAWSRIAAVQARTGDATDAIAQVHQEFDDPYMRAHVFAWSAAALHESGK